MLVGRYSDTRTLDERTLEYGAENQVGCEISNSIYKQKVSDNAMLCYLFNEL